MAFVVTKPCHDCKYTDCVVVCPCECFYEDDHMVYIDPEDCIDCGVCVPECPVEAIFPDIETPSQWQEYIELNAVRSARLKEEERNITEKKEPKVGAGCSST